MEIHVICPRDTLWGLAHRYGISISNIIQANRLDELPALISGQALLIPKPDGGIVKIPKVLRKSGTIEVNGYVKPGKDVFAMKKIQDAAGLLTYISPYTYRINEDGSIRDLYDDAVMTVAKRHHLLPVMTLTGCQKKGFSKSCHAGIFRKPDAWTFLTGNILDKIKEKHYHGLSLNLNEVSWKDWSLIRPFIFQLADALHRMGKLFNLLLSFELFNDDKENPSQEPLYVELNKIADFIILKTHGKYMMGELPRAAAPIKQIKSKLDVLTRWIPANKILLDLWLGGYDWPLPVINGREVKEIDLRSAIILASRYKSSIQYDGEAQAPFFDYTDEKGTGHRVWFEDVRSIREKYIAVSEYGLRGISYSDLDMVFPQNWPLLEDMFRIKKM